MRKKTDGKQGVSIRLSPEALRVVEAVENLHGLTRSSAIEMIVRDYGRRHELPGEGQK